MESAWPRTIAAVCGSSLRGGSDSRALSPISAGRSAAKATSRLGLRAMARKAPATERLNASLGTSLAFSPGLRLEDMLGPDRRRVSGERDVHRALRQLRAEGALVELRHQRPLQ